MITSSSELSSAAGPASSRLLSVTGPDCGDRGTSLSMEDTDVGGPKCKDSEVGGPECLSAVDNDVGGPKYVSTEDSEVGGGGGCRLVAGELL